MKKYKILVVDDEENIRGVLFDILTDEGYSVSLAEDGETALRMIRAEAPDLVLLDIWIPGIDGLQTLKILKKISVNTEVVMMSGHGAIDTAVKATKLGAYDFIEKPFTLETILNKVSGALSEREPQAVQEVKETSPSLSLESWFAGSSDVAVQTRSDIHNGIKSGGPVLVAGPAGCGKEYAARLIHVKRGKGTFVSVECGKLNEDDLDWDRLTSRIGEETANGSSASSLKTTGGTLYFDKLNQLSHKAQRRLAKVLADNAPGGKAGKDIYIIGSVMQPQEKGSRTVLLHKPLLSYFGGVSVRIKSLQERSGDIPELVASLAFDLAEKYDKRIEKVDSALIDAIGHTAFKGNTRELYNFLELAVLACEGVDLTGEYISISGRGSFTPHAPKRAHPVYSKEPAQGN
ncbi:MAG: response regulator, partial [Nitrospinota bacterium]|nr:response regulator [Nitrospinota bacterium]